MWEPVQLIGCIVRETTSPSHPVADGDEIVDEARADMAKSAKDGATLTLDI